MKKTKPTATATATAVPVNPLPPATGGIDSVPPVHGAGKPIPGAVIETPGAAPVTNDAARVENEKPKIVWPQPARASLSDVLDGLADAVHAASAAYAENVENAEIMARKAAALNPDLTAADIEEAAALAGFAVEREVERTRAGMATRVAQVIPLAQSDKQKAKDAFRENPGHVYALMTALPREIADGKVQFSATGKVIARRVRCDAKKLLAYAMQQGDSVATAILHEAWHLAKRNGRFLAGMDSHCINSFTLVLKSDKPTCSPSRDAYIPFPE